MHHKHPVNPTAEADLLVVRYCVLNDVGLKRDRNEPSTEMISRVIRLRKTSRLNYRPGAAGRRGQGARHGAVPNNTQAGKLYSYDAQKRDKACVTFRRLRHIRSVAYVYTRERVKGPIVVDSIPVHHQIPSLALKTLLILNT